jgi:hypothetical protein
MPKQLAESIEPEMHTQLVKPLEPEVPEPPAEPKNERKVPEQPAEPEIERKAPEQPAEA